MRIRHTSSVGDSEIKPILRANSVKITVNKEIINSEIKRLQSEIGKYNNKTDDNNLKMLISYLTRVKRIADSETSELSLHWGTNADGTLRSTPIHLFNEQIYNVDVSSFIELNPTQQLVSIDISALSEVIAFDMINRDLDETHTSIEEVLDTCSIVSPNDVSILIDKFKANNDKMYEYSQYMRIGESTFLNKNDSLMYNYFMTRSYPFDKDTSTYKEPVKNSCMLAAGIYAAQLIYNAHKCKVDCSLVEITHDKIVLLINRENDPLFDFKEKAYESIILETFGRKFSIVPDIMIY